MIKKKSILKCLLVTEEVEFENIYSSLHGLIIGDVEVNLEFHSSPKNKPSIYRRSRKESYFVETLQNVDLVLANINALSSNLYYELGIARALGKPTVFFGNGNFLHDFPFAIRRNSFFILGEGDDVINEIKQFLTNYIENPSKFNPTKLIDSERDDSIEIDLSKIDARDFENLCFELLSGLGYRSLEWNMKDDFIDAVCTLKKKDPDGFEYNEYWFISFEDIYKDKAFFDIVLHDPEYLTRRVFRNLQETNILNKRISYNEINDIPVTFLFISRKRDNRNRFQTSNRINREIKLNKFGTPSTIRFRFWEEFALIKLIQENSQLARKYFSLEAKTKAGVRLSYEELYKQYVDKNAELQKANRDLVAEKNRAKILERDAAWKLLSFTAAHRLGNPIDAIDSEISNLKAAIKIERMDIVNEILDGIELPIEKAKSIVSQFRNLSIAHEIELKEINADKLNEIIKLSAKQAIDKDVLVTFDLLSDYDLAVDVQKISECFDEIIRNALHFVNGENKKIIITSTILNQFEKPDSLDKTKDYIKIAFSDNGCGVAIEKKLDIFKPFERSYIHGTGLGLAFCEIIIEKHGGIIRETGKYGEGATFEIILPVIHKNIH